MEHLVIAYDLFVIMIGLAALSIVVFWTARTGESDLRNFSILYSCSTLILTMVLKKYLFLIGENYSDRAGYLLSGAISENLKPYIEAAGSGQFSCKNMTSVR